MITNGSFQYTANLIESTAGDNTPLNVPAFNSPPTESRRTGPITLHLRNKWIFVHPSTTATVAAAFNSLARCPATLWSSTEQPTHTGSMLNLKSLSIQFDDVFFKTLDDDDDDVDDNGGVYGYCCVGQGWGCLLWTVR